MTYCDWAATEKSTPVGLIVGGTGIESVGIQPKTARLQCKMFSHAAARRQSADIIRICDGPLEPERSRISGTRDE